MGWPANAYIGQKIVCVGGPDRIIFYWEIQPKRNAVYTIRDIRPRGDRLAFLLVEIVNPPANYDQGFDECGFWASRFKPVKTFKNDISIFQRIVDKVNKKIKEPV